MKVAYLDCSSGISGDMFAGALVDAGVPLKHLEKELSKIPLTGYRIQKRNVKRCGIKAAKFDVIVERRSQKGRTWSDVRKIITSSKLDSDIKRSGLKLFKRLFDVEAKVHGRRSDKVHLHELGAVDCIVDIFSVLLGLRYLDIKKVYASPVNLGNGSIETEHGELAVPAPATLSLLKGADIYATDTELELTTPTGALLLSVLVGGYGDIPSMRLINNGLGAGSRDLKTMPNVLRVIIGERHDHMFHEDIYVVETNIDDMNPQLYEHVMEEVFKLGAVDVFLTSIMMKKQRPGVKLSALVNKERLDKIINVFLSETTTIGVRFSRWSRIASIRESVKIKTKFGNIAFKKVFMEHDSIRIFPEYDECRKIAVKTGMPIIEVFDILTKYAKIAENAPT